MRYRPDPNVDLFVSQCLTAVPCSKAEMRAYTVQQARLRDEGRIAANLLVSTQHLTGWQVNEAVKAMQAGRAAVQQLTMQALPWAFKRAAPWSKDKYAAVELAVESAMHCAQTFNPVRGCLSTVVASDVRFKALRRYKQLGMVHDSRTLAGELLDHDRGHEEMAEQEAGRRKLMWLISKVPYRRLRRVLRLRAQGLTFDVCGRLMSTEAKPQGISKERCRQLERLGLIAMRVIAGTASGVDKARYAKYQRTSAKMLAFKRRRMAVA